LLFFQSDLCSNELKWIINFQVISIDRVFNGIGLEKSFKKRHVSDLKVDVETIALIYILYSILYYITSIYIYIIAPLNARRKSQPMWPINIGCDPLDASNDTEHL